jgi:hypothetical protein
MTNNELKDLSDSQYIAFIAENFKWVGASSEYRRLLSIVEKLQNYDSRALLEDLRKQ